MTATLINKKFIDDLTAQARASARLRSHYCLHQSHQDMVQRVYIGAEPGTYLRPHAHLETDKWEYISVVQGAVEFFLFSPQGVVEQRITLSAGGETTAIEISPGTWHTLVVMQTGTILFEVKPGPFDARSIACFAEWSPQEGETGCQHYIEHLLRLHVGDTASA